MAWTIEFNEKSKRELESLNRQVQVRITNFLQERMATSDSPRAIGDALTGEWKGYWRYRVGDFRVIVDMEEDKLVVHVVRVAHRREVY